VIAVGQNRAQFWVSVRGSTRLSIGLSHLTLFTSAARTIRTESRAIAR